jgi:hypothetical protein
MSDKSNSGASNSQTGATTTKSKAGSVLSEEEWEAAAAIALKARLPDLHVLENTYSRIAVTPLDARRSSGGTNSTQVTTTQTSDAGSIKPDK